MIEQYSTGMRTHAIGSRSQNAAAEKQPFALGQQAHESQRSIKKRAPKPRPERLENRTILQQSYSHSIREAWLWWRVVA